MGQNDVELGIRATGGDAAAAELRKPAEAVKELPPEFEAARAALAKFDAAAEQGAKGLDRLGAQADIALDKVRARMAALESPTAAEAAELANLEAKLLAASGKANDFNDKLQISRDRIGDADEVLRKISPELANFAVGWNLASGLMSQAQGILTDVVSGLNDTAKALGGVGNEFDGLDSKMGPAIGKLKSELPNLISLLKDLAKSEGDWIEQTQKWSEAHLARQAGLKTEAEELAAYEEAKAKWADAVEKANDKAARSEEDRAKKAEAAAAREAAELERVREELDKQYVARQHYQEQVETINASTLDAATKAELLAKAQEQLDQSLAKLAEDGLPKVAAGTQQVAEKFNAAKAEVEGLARTMDYVFTYGDRAKVADDKAAEAKARNADATKELEAAEAELARLRAINVLDPAQQARLDELEAGQFQRQETARRLAQEQLRWEQEATQLRKRQKDEENQNHAEAAKSQGAVVDQLTAQAEAAGKLGEALAAMNTEWSRAVDLAGQFMAILGGGAKAAGAGGATP